MGNVHTLDIYPHLGSRSCLGCVPDDRVEADGGDESVAEHRPPAPARRAPPIGRSYREPDRLRDSPAPAPRALYSAAWDRSHARLCETVDLRVHADGFPEDTPVRFAILDSAGTIAAEVETRLRGDSGRARWVPDTPGRYRFEASTADRTASSGVLEVDSWVEIALRAGPGVSLENASWRCGLVDGSERTGRLGESDAMVRLEGIPEGPVRFTLTAMETGPDGERTAEPPDDTDTAGAGQLSVGQERELEDAARHVLTVSAGLVLGFRIPRSMLARSDAELVVTAASGEEVARRPLRSGAMPRGDTVRFLFPEVHHRQVGARLVWPGGIELSLFVEGTAERVDVRQGTVPGGSAPATDESLWRRIQAGRYSQAR